MTVTNVPVASVTVSPASGSVTVGATVQLAAVTKDAAGNVLTGRTVTWSSSNTSVATVSGTGLVTGLTAGTATITATSEGVASTAATTVTAPTNPGTVTDLAVVGVADTGVTLAFTEVTDGTGLPASYDVRYQVGTITWGSTAPSATRGTCTTPVAGTAIGAKRTCTVLGLTPATAYQFQLTEFRGTLNLNAIFGGLSNIAGATSSTLTYSNFETDDPTPTPTGQFTLLSGDGAGTYYGKVYVVRVLAQEPDDQKLRTQFLESGYNELVVMLGRNEAWRTSVECIRGIEDQYHVKWQRPPDERRRM